MRVTQLQIKKIYLIRKKNGKSRAKEFKDNGGVSASGKKYIYLDDKAIQKKLKIVNKQNKKFSLRKKVIDIGTVKIDKNKRIKEVSLVIDTKKDIKIKTGADNAKVNVGVVKTGKKSKLKKVNILIQAQNIKIEK